MNWNEKKNKFPPKLKRKWDDEQRWQTLKQKTHTISWFLRYGHRDRVCSRSITVAIFQLCSTVKIRVAWSSAASVVAEYNIGSGGETVGVGSIETNRVTGVNSTGSCTGTASYSAAINHGGVQGSTCWEFLADEGNVCKIHCTEPIVEFSVSHRDLRCMDIREVKTNVYSKTILPWTRRQVDRVSQQRMSRR